MTQLSVEQLPSITFSVLGLCCPNLESWLFKHRCMALFVGFIFYLPLLSVLAMLFFANVIFTIIINIFVIVVCCNWIPHRKLLKIPERKDINKYGVMLETSNSTSNMLSKMIIEFDAECLNNNKKAQITILSFNVDTHWDKFWQRYPLLLRLFKQYPSDIICIQECITTKVWDFGTLQTIKNINKSYNGYFIGVKEMFSEYIPILCRYSFLWRIIIELQLILEIYFAMPFWKGLAWDCILGGNWIARYGFLILTGLPMHFGNAILFKNNKELYYKSFIMLPGDRNAMRCLYDMTKENGKKIWVVCCHFSCEEEQETFYSERSISVTQCDIMLKWMEDAQRNIMDADYIVICGDFNVPATSDVYQCMIDGGYKSIMYEKYNEEKPTYISGTWTCNQQSKLNDIIESVTYDYIWIKNFSNLDDDVENMDIKINECKVVGDEYVMYEDRIHASDHLGIYVNITL
eukprot:512668_1